MSCGSKHSIEFVRLSLVLMMIIIIIMYNHVNMVYNYNDCVVVSPFPVLFHLASFVTPCFCENWSLIIAYAGPSNRKATNCQPKLNNVHYSLRSRLCSDEANEKIREAVIKSWCRICQMFEFSGGEWI